MPLQHNRGDSRCTILTETTELTLTLESEFQGKVFGDSRQLRRVFCNLIDNAVKYTPPGGQVQVKCWQAEGAAVASVTDTGVGISEEHLSRFFDRFYRVDPSRTGDNAGAGLGLSICKSVIQAAGGTISVTSTIGQGTTMTVRLRLSQ